jgi:hypothetical protein
LKSKTIVIDSNCYLGNWPTRRLRHNGAESLRRLARENGVQKCLVSSLEAIFHRDHTAANRALEVEISGMDDMIPVPIVNPASPIDGGASGRLFRLVPCYHRYSLSKEPGLQLLEDAERRDATVFVSLRMRDSRLSHPLIGARPAEIQPIIDSASSFPGLRLIINNAKAREIEQILSATDNTYLGCEWSLPIGFVKSVVESYGDGRLVFGSNAPLHYYQCSLLQILEADIPPRSREMILGGNMASISG